MSDEDGGMSEPGNGGRDWSKSWIGGGPIPPDPEANKKREKDNVYRLKNKRDEPAWCRYWQRSDSDAPLTNLRNVMVTLRNHEVLSKIIRFNDWDQSIWLMGQIPGTAEDPNIPRPLKDQDILSIQEEIQLFGLRRVSRETVNDGITLRAREQCFNPVVDYLNGLTWDGTPRLDTWLVKYMGAEDKPYTRTIGKLFLIAMIARALQPGCKADYMLIFEGPQGIMKSSACRVLAADWYSDNLPDLSRGDQIRIAQHLRGRWLIEIAEMSSFNAAETHRLKEFVTRSEEIFLPKFGRIEVHEPRSCLFIGTTNESVYLKDTTGNRRFWPVAVMNILLEALAADRDQLLAEAVTLYREGHPWWPDRDFETQYIAPEQEARLEEDAWQPDVQKWLDGGLWVDAYGNTIDRRQADTCTIAEVATEALNVQTGNISKAMQYRISGILTALGWEKGRNMHGTVFKRPKK